ncbi:uncharacterized protein [Procambarus clarkii]|uniref:uncharacterized protein n=1 Tax=Procambarus clarkii TaxID=6728 RepID=UPI003742B386
MADSLTEIQDKAVIKAQKLYSTIQQWMTQRRSTINVLNRMAGEIEEVHDNATVARWVGTGVSTAGSLAMIGSGIATLCTGGLAAPLLIGSIAGTVAGTATSTVAQVIDGSKQSDKIQTANSAAQRDEQLGDRVKKLLTDLHDLCEKELRVLRDEDTGSLSASADSDKEQLSIEQLVTGYLYGAISLASGDTHTRFFLPCDNTLNIMELDTTLYRGSSSRHPGAQGEYLATKFTSTFAVASLNCIPKVGIKILEEVAAKSLGKSASKIGVGAGAKILGKATIVGGGLGLMFDIKEIIEIGTEGKLESCSQLRESAAEMKRQLNTMEREFEAVAKVAKLKAKLRKILDNTTMSTEETVSQLMSILKQTQPEATKAIKKDDGLMFTLVWGLRNIYQYFRDYIEKEIMKKRYPRNHYDLIIISHGGIRPEPCPVPVSILSEGFRQMIFYSPWSCLVDASVVYSIGTGCIKPNNRRFFQCSSKTNVALSNLPSWWNSINKKTFHVIPTVMLHALKYNESAYQALKQLTCDCLRKRDTNTRLVVPYMAIPGIEEVSVPLWLVAVICSLIGTLLNMEFTYHHAACLSKEWGRVWPEDLITRYHQQYYFITPVDDVAMIVTNPHPKDPYSRESYNIFEKVVGPLL